MTREGIILYAGRIGPKLALEGEALFATGSKNSAATVEVERGGKLFNYVIAPYTNANALQMDINSPTSFAKWSLIRFSSKLVLHYTPY